MSYFIKVCGITNLSDLQLVSSLSTNAVGFNLYDKSKRFIDLPNAIKLAANVPEQLQIVLIFVNHPKEFISQCLKDIPKAIPQFHGDETKDFCESFEVDFIKAIRIKKDTDLEKINQDYKNAKMLIFDSYDEKEYGGTGRTFDLGLLEDKISVPFLAAGGIDKLNFQDALLLKNCIGIDVCSSVEEVPGVKNHAKVKDLLEKIRSFNV